MGRRLRDIRIGVGKLALPGAALATLATLGLLVAPAWTDQRTLHIMTVILVYIPLALGQNLITGNSGQISMGHAAFWGIGAYAAALLTLNMGAPGIVAILVAIVVAGAIGLVTGLPAIRISGDYLFIVTIGLNFIFLDLVIQTPALGGGIGLAAIPPFRIGGWEATEPAGHFYLALVVALASIGITTLITTSRFGRVVEAVRDDPVAAMASGINPTPVRVAIFTVGAALAGGAGAVLAFFLSYAGPTSFPVDQSLLVFEMVIIGGLGSVPGSILGAILLIGIPEVLRPLQDYRLGLGGLAAVVLMMVRPQGLLGRVKVTRLGRS